MQDSSWRSYAIDLRVLIYIRFVDHIIRPFLSAIIIQLTDHRTASIPACSLPVCPAGRADRMTAKSYETYTNQNSPSTPIDWPPHAARLGQPQQI